MKRILSTVLLLASFVLASAQTVIKVNAPNLVASDEQFNVTFVIEGENKPSSFSWDPGEDFQLVWGPQKGSSTSVSIVNGKRTSSSQTTYTYVLMPRKTGTFQLQAALAVVKGEEIASKRASIQVVSNGADASRQGGSSQGGSSQSSQGFTQQSDPSAIPSEDIFMKMYVSKSKAVVGETITATLKLFQRVNIAGFEDAKFPTFNGFWSQEQQAPTNIEFQRENVGDRIYNTAVLRSWTLIPQKAGEIRIDPAELVCLVNIRASHSSSNSIFDSFFQDDYQTVRKRVTTPAIAVKVSNVPSGAPASFGGGVGTFKMDASLSRSELKAHEAASLKVVVTGKGNISLLEAPKINFPPDFEVYDVKTSETAQSKTFEFPFIPRSHGDFVLDPVEYSYYDVNSGKYVTLRSPQMSLKVERGEESSVPAMTGGQLVTNPNRKDVKSLGSDIRFIETDMPALSRKGWFFAGSTAFWIILAALALAAAAVYFLLRSYAARRADLVGSKNRAANKMARKRLSQAGVFLSKDLYSAFYEELHKALLGYVGDKLNMNAYDMSKENISERLKEAGISDEVSGQFTELLDACEFARYSPSEGHEAMNAHYENAVSVISTIDNNMGRKRKISSALALLPLLLLPLGAQAAQSADSLWTNGCNAYTEGRWSEALESWTAICGTGSESSILYYNIGNAYFKTQDYAHAILYYERALRLDPSDPDARYNLEFARSQIQDRIESVPEFFLETWGRKLCWIMPSGTWAVLCIVFFALALAMLLMFLLGNSGARKAGFFISIAAFLLFLLSLDFALWQKRDGLSQDKAVVTTPVVSVKSSPGSDSSKDLFVIHEGTEVTILDSVGEWRNIELSDGRQGWMRRTEAEVI